MPTGVALHNAKDMLFDAAVKVLHRDGASRLTSRAVTTEAGVAKGVMHRHFVDFDAFIAALILDRVAQLEGSTAALRDAAGTGTVTDNLTEALVALFDPLAVAIVALVIMREGLRARLREVGASRIPIMTEGSAMLTTYLVAEQALGRVAVDADLSTVSLTLIGAVHLLFTDRESGPPDTNAVRKVAVSALHGLV